jgi:hypothetical protein
MCAEVTENKEIAFWRVPKSAQATGIQGDKSGGKWKGENGKWARSVEDKEEAMEEGRGILWRAWIREFTRDGTMYYFIFQLPYKVFRYNGMQERSNGRVRERK